MDLEAQIIGVVFAICAGMLFFWAVPSYVIRHVGPGKLPPLPRGLVPIRSFDLIDFVGISLFFGMYGLMWVAGAVAEEKVDLSKIENLPLRLAETMVFQGFQIGMVVVFLIWRMNLITAFGLRMGPRGWYIIFSPLVVLLMYGFMSNLELTGYNQWIKSLVGDDGQQDAVKLLAENKDPLTLAMMALVACVGAPLAEEVVFRGYIYAAVKRFTNIPFAVVLTGLFFGVVHGNLAALLPLTVLGILLALAYEFTGTLWVPIAIHFLFNAATTSLTIYHNLNSEIPENLEKLQDAGLILFW